MIADDLKNFLDEKAILYNRPEFIETDPIQIPRAFTGKENIEISGFLTATISWGNRTSIIRNGHRLMRLMDYQPFDFLISASPTELKKASSFIHRTFNPEDTHYFFQSLQNIYRMHGGLEAVFTQGYLLERSIYASLSYFHKTFFELSGPSRTRKHLADVTTGSAAKRLNMFLRWMIRKDNNGVDLGLWNRIPASQLMLPLDIHTGNVARKLGLLTRRQNDWKALEEIMPVLRSFDPHDPVKYDFALFGLGAFEKF
jgi:uncharacterized protein (TIGR02757 family)